MMATARDALLDAAAKLFSDKGYSSVSTRELADAAGVNLGAIQYHFGSKAKLFIETIQRMMEQSTCSQVRVAEDTPIENVHQAALVLYAVIESLMDSLLQRQGPQPCRLMFREILSSTAENQEVCEALVAAAVEHFSQPLERVFLRALAVVSPNSPRKELQFFARSISGQCTFYLSHRHFVERIDGTSLSDPVVFRDTVDHIFCFSLRAMRCSDAFISSVLDAAHEDAKSRQEIMEKN